MQWDIPFGRAGNPNTQIWRGLGEKMHLMVGWWVVLSKDSIHSWLTWPSVLVKFEQSGDKEQKSTSQRDNYLAGLSEVWLFGWLWQATSEDHFTSHWVLLIDPTG